MFRPVQVRGLGRGRGLLEVPSHSSLEGDEASCMEMGLGFHCTSSVNDAVARSMGARCELHHLSSVAVVSPCHPNLPIQKYGALVAEECRKSCLKRDTEAFLRKLRNSCLKKNRVIAVLYLLVLPYHLRRSTTPPPCN